MFEKDYLMRFIQALLEAINKIVNSIDKEDIEGAKKQLTDSYNLLGNKEDYFLNTHCKELIGFFKMNYPEAEPSRYQAERDYLKRVQLLAELFYLDAKVEKNNHLKLEKYKKAKTLFQHYIKFSKEYSFEVRNKLILIDSKLEKL